MPPMLPGGRAVTTEAHRSGPRSSGPSSAWPTRCAHGAKRRAAGPARSTGPPARHAPAGAPPRWRVRARRLSPRLHGPPRLRHLGHRAGHREPHTGATALHPPNQAPGRLDPRGTSSRPSDAGQPPTTVSPRPTRPGTQQWPDRAAARTWPTPSTQATGPTPAWPLGASAGAGTTCLPPPASPSASPALRMARAQQRSSPRRAGAPRRRT